MKRKNTLFGILAAALLLAAASFAGLKPSNNATRQEVESDTTLAVKGILDIESGGALKFAGTTFSAGDYVPVTKAGQQTITATGTGNDISLTAADAIKLATGVGSEFSVNGGAAAANGYDVMAADNDITFSVYDATRTSYLELNSGGFDAVLATGTYFNWDLGGGVDELRVNESRVIVGVPLAIPATATLPTCDTTIAPAGFYAYAVDTTGPDLCYCNGTSWAPTDGSGTCA